MPPKIFIKKPRKEGEPGGYTQVPVTSMPTEDSGIYPTGTLGETIEITYDFQTKPQRSTLNFANAPTLLDMLKGNKLRPVRTLQLTHNGTATLELKNALLVLDLERNLNPNRPQRTKPLPDREKPKPPYSITEMPSHSPGIKFFHRIIPESEVSLRNQIGNLMADKGMGTVYAYRTGIWQDFEGQPLVKGFERIYTGLPDKPEIVEAYEKIVRETAEFEAKMANLGMDATEISKALQLFIDPKLNDLDIMVKNLMRIKD